MVPETQKYHHGDLRRSIMNAALETIGESGIERLSMREIARKIGVTTAAPYHHFKDRQDLLLELAIEGYGQLLRRLEEGRDTVRGAEKQIRAATTAYLRFGREQKAQYSIMFSGEFASHPRLGEMVAVANQCLEIVRRSIAVSTNLGEIATSEAAFCAWSLLHGILMLDRNGVLQETPAEQERLAIQGVLGIVRGRTRQRENQRSKLP